MHNAALLQRAKRRDFFVKSLLHFRKFLVNPSFDLETNYILRQPMDRRFQWYIVRIRKYWQLFTHESNIKMQSKTPFKQWGRTSSRRYLSFPLGMWALSNTPIPRLDRPTHHPKQHPDPISRFATIQPPDRQTDGLGDMSVPTPAYSIYLL